MKKKPKYNPDRKPKFCDPGACDCCMYIGDGDFLCDEHQVIVVEDWSPSEDYMICRKGKNKYAGHRK